MGYDAKTHIGLKQVKEFHFILYQIWLHKSDTYLYNIFFNIYFTVYKK